MNLETVEHNPGQNDGVERETLENGPISIMHLEVEDNPGQNDDVETETPENRPISIMHLEVENNAGQNDDVETETPEYGPISIMHLEVENNPGQNFHVLIRPPINSVQEANLVPVPENPHFGIENPIIRLENPHYEPNEKQAQPQQQETLKRKYETMLSDEESDSHTCSICLEMWSNCGSHRLCSIKCGHFFGSECIKRWLSEKPLCPQCKTPANKTDIRFHYVTNVIAMDTIVQVQQQLTIDKLRKQNAILNLELAKERLRLSAWMADADKFQMERQALIGGKSSNNSAVSINRISFSLVHSISVEQGGSRVCCFNANIKTFAVTIETSNPLFRSYGIQSLRKYDGQFKSSKYVSVHNNTIRDICFHPETPNIILSVSFDKTAKITDLVNNANKTFKAESYLWSCCWDLGDSNLFYAGCSTGNVIVYDRRESMPTNTLSWEGDQSPAVALCAVPPQGEFKGGILCCRFRAVTLYERVSKNFIEFQFDISGPFFSLIFDEKTNHFVASCRASAEQGTVRHLYCELVIGGPSKTYRLVHTFLGGTRQTLISRPSFLRVADEILFAAHHENASSIDIWSTKTGLRIHSLSFRKPVLHICQVGLFSQPSIAVISDSKVRFFESSLPTCE